eukprot:SAG11_NODE_442_length_9427_cov_486.939751_2_plen_2729_part_00
MHQRGDGLGHQRRSVAQRVILDENLNRRAPKARLAGAPDRISHQVNQAEARLESSLGLMRDEMDRFMLQVRKELASGSQGRVADTVDLKGQIGQLRDTLVRLVPGGEQAARAAVETNQPLLADRQWVQEQVGRGVNDVASKFHLAKLEMKRDLAGSVSEHRDDIHRLEQTLQSRIDAATVQLREELSRVRKESGAKSLEDRLGSLESYLSDNWHLDHSTGEISTGDIATLRSAFSREQALRESQETRFAAELSSLRSRLDESHHNEAQISKRLEEVASNGRTFIGQVVAEMDSVDHSSISRKPDQLVEEAMQGLRVELSTLMDEKLRLQKVFTESHTLAPTDTTQLSKGELKEVASQITDMYLQDLTSIFGGSLDDSEQQDKSSGRIALRSDVVSIGLEQARLKDAVSRVETEVLSRIKKLETSSPEPISHAKLALSEAQTMLRQRVPDAGDGISVNLIAGYAAEIESKLTASQVDCRMQVVAAANQYKEQLNSCEAKFESAVNALRAEDAMEGLAVRTWLQSIETRMEGASEKVNARLGNLQAAMDSNAAAIDSVIDLPTVERCCEGFAMRSAQSALDAAEGKIGNLEQEMNEIFEEHVIRMAELENNADGMKNTLEGAGAHITEVEARILEAEAELQRQSSDASRANIMGESALSLLELQMDGKVAEGVMKVQAQMATEREDQLRASRALRRLQKMLSRPDAGAIFRTFDKDGDGTIDRQELKEGFEKIGEPLDDKDVDALMALVDSDGDGNVDYREFEQTGKMSEKMLEMASKEQEERQRLVDLVTSMEQKMTDLVETRCTDVVESTTAALASAVETAVESAVDSAVVSQIQPAVDLAVNSKVGPAVDLAVDSAVETLSQGRTAHTEPSISFSPQLEGDVVQIKKDIMKMKDDFNRVKSDSNQAHDEISSIQSNMDSGIGLLRDLIQTRNNEQTTALEDEISKLHGKVAEGVMKVQAQMATEREDQLRASRALRRLQKMLSRPDAGAIFRTFDKDGDGTIDRQELKEGFEKIGEPLDDKDVDALMALVDSDGDGNVDYREFEQTGKMSEKMLEMASKEQEERQRLVDLVTSMEQKMTDLVETRCTDIAKSVSNADEKLHESVDTLSSQIEEMSSKVAAESSERRSTQRKHQQMLANVRRAIETHTQGLELVQAHIDVVHKESSEADVANMTECMVLRAAQIRHEERSAKALNAASTALQEVHRHTESLVTLQEDVVHDRMVCEKAMGVLHEHIGRVAGSLADAEVHTTLNFATIQAAIGGQHEQIMKLKAQFELVNSLQKSSQVARELSKTEVASLARVVRASITAVQDHVDMVDDKVEQMDAHYATELFMYQYGLQRFAEDMATATDKQGEQNQVFAEQLGHLDKHLAQEIRDVREVVGKTAQAMESEISDLERGTGLAINAVQKHVDVLEDKLSTAEVEFSAEFIILHALVGRSGQYIDGEMTDTLDISQNDLAKLGSEVQKHSAALEQFEAKYRYIESEVSTIVAPLSDAFEEAQSRITVLEDQHAWTTGALADMSMSPTAEGGDGVEDGAKARRMREAVRIELAKSSLRMDELEHLLRTNSDRVEAANMDLNRLEEGTRLAVEAVQSHVDAVEEAIDHSEVAFSAEFVLVHAMLAAQAQEVEGLDASINQDIDERVSKSDTSYFLQFEEIETKLEDLTDEVRHMQQNYGGINLSALEDQIREKTAADIRPKLEEIQVEISLERQFLITALEEQERKQKSAVEAVTSGGGGFNTSSGDVSNSQLEQAVRLLHDKVLNMDVENSLDRELAQAATEVQQRKMHDVKTQMDSLESRTELELQKLEHATEAAVRAIQDHVDVVQDNVEQHLEITFNAPSPVAPVSEPIEMKAPVELAPVETRTARSQEHVSPIEAAEDGKIEIAQREQFARQPLGSLSTSSQGYETMAAAPKESGRYPLSDDVRPTDGALERLRLCEERLTEIDVASSMDREFLRAALDGQIAKNSEEIASVEARVLDEISRLETDISMDRQLAEAAFDRFSTELTVDEGPTLTAQPGLGGLSASLISDFEKRDVESSFDLELLKAAVHATAKAVHNLEGTTTRHISTVAVSKTELDELRKNLTVEMETREVELSMQQQLCEAQISRMSAVLDKHQAQAEAFEARVLAAESRLVSLGDVDAKEEKFEGDTDSELKSEHINRRIAEVEKAMHQRMDHEMCAFMAELVQASAEFHITVEQSMLIMAEKLEPHIVACRRHVTDLEVRFDNEMPELRAMLGARVDSSENGSGAVPDQHLMEQMQSLSLQTRSSARALYCLLRLVADPNSSDMLTVLDVAATGNVSREDLLEVFEEIGELLKDVELETLLTIAGGDAGGNFNYKKFVHLGSATQETALLKGRLESVEAAVLSAEGGVEELGAHLDDEVERIQRETQSRLEQLAANVGQARPESGAMEALHAQVGEVKEHVEELEALVTEQLDGFAAKLSDVTEHLEVLDVAQKQKSKEPAAAESATGVERVEAAVTALSMRLGDELASVSVAIAGGHGELWAEVTALAETVDLQAEELQQLGRGEASGADGGGGAALHRVRAELASAIDSADMDHAEKLESFQRETRRRLDELAQAVAEAEVGGGAVEALRKQVGAVEEHAEELEAVVEEQAEGLEQLAEEVEERLSSLEVERPATREGAAEFEVVEKKLHARLGEEVASISVAIAGGHGELRANLEASVTTLNDRLDKEMAGVQVSIIQAVSEVLLDVDQKLADASRAKT